MSEYNFDDVEPLPLNPEGITVATILYSEEYKLNLGLLKALQAKNEYSERALYLTQEVIKLNAAHYTVWQYRLHNVKKLGKSIDDELDWVEEIALDNIKNYQIWNYRQSLLKLQDIKNPEREFPLIEVMLDDDSKNYHVWSYRKWIVQWSEVWNFELGFTEKYLKEDVYNNSAWSHRYFTLFANPDSKISNSAEFEKEKEFVISKISIAPHNVSSWNYLIGIYEKLERPLDELKELASAHANIEKDSEGISVPALELLANINRSDDKGLSKQLYGLLSTKYDPIRSNYWNYQQSLVV